MRGGELHINRSSGILGPGYIYRQALIFSFKALFSNVASVGVLRQLGASQSSDTPCERTCVATEP